MAKSQAIKASRVVLYLVLLIATVFFLFPIYMLVVTSLKSLREVYATASYSPPHHIDLAGFATAWQGLDQGFLASVSFTVPAVALSVFLGSLAGFALTKLKFRGANTVFMLMLLGMFLPYQVVLIPLVRLMARLHLYGTIWSLIITHVAYGAPITTMIFRNFYSGIPTVLVESGQVDGATFWQIYTRVIVPVSIPGAVVALTWQFTNIWNNFLFGLVLGANPSIRPVTVALNNLAGTELSQWNTLMAGALMTALPTLLVYLFLGRYFVRGLLGGAVKQ
jgi:glucose/mannose transport system permease protein